MLRKLRGDRVRALLNEISKFKEGREILVDETLKRWLVDCTGNVEKPRSTCWPAIFVIRGVGSPLADCPVRSEAMEDMCSEFSNRHTDVSRSIGACGVQCVPR